MTKRKMIPIVRIGWKGAFDAITKEGAKLIEYAGGNAELHETWMAAQGKGGSRPQSGVHYYLTAASVKRLKEELAKVKA